MLSNFKQTVKKHQSDIIITAIVVLLCLLAFALGFIMAKYQTKEPIQFIDNQQTVK